MCHLRVADGGILALFELLQFVVVSQFEQRPLKVIHLLDFAHHILIDPVHYLLQHAVI